MIVRNIGIRETIGDRIILTTITHECDNEKDESDYSTIEYRNGRWYLFIDMESDCINFCPSCGEKLPEMNDDSIIIEKIYYWNAMPNWKRLIEEKKEEKNKPIRGYDYRDLFVDFGGELFNPTTGKYYVSGSHS